MNFVSSFITIELLFYCGNAFEAYQMEMQSTSPPELENNLLLLKGPTCEENSIVQKPNIQEIQSQNSELVNLIENAAKTAKPSKDNVKITISDRVNIVEPTRAFTNRPFFAGETGGNSRPQLIPPGTPWPAFPVNKPQIINNGKPQAISPIKPSSGKPNIDTSKITTTKVPIVDRIEDTTRPLSNRPPFAGQTGGNFRPQIIQSGTQWPSRPNKPGTAAVTTKKPQIVDRFEVTSTWATSPGFIWNANGVVSSTFPPLIRPPINSMMEKPFQIFRPSKPKPFKPEITTRYPPIVDRFEETSPFPFSEVTSIPTRPTPDRPFYAGQTGGNYYPELIPPGKPWPARPQDYSTTRATKNTGTQNSPLGSQPTVPVEPSILMPDFDDRFEKNPSPSPTQSTFGYTNVTSGRPTPSGSPSLDDTSGNMKPAKSTTSNSLLEDKYNESSSLSPNKVDGVGTNVPTRPPPNRPPFAGETGGNFKPQIVPPGTPWPEKPEEKTTGRSSTTDGDIPQKTTPLSLLLNGVSESTPGILFTSRPVPGKKN